MPKPAFDPSQPFEKAAKPAFDPSQPFDKAGEDTTSPTPTGPLSGLDSAITQYFDKPVVSAIGAIGRGVDRFTGAPTRAAISAGQNADTPGDIIPDALKAGWNQFGADPSLAPTGEAIADKGFGLTPGSKTSKVAGFLMDAAANPLNLLAFGPAKQLASKAGALAEDKAALKTVEAAGATTKDLKRLGGGAEDLGQFAHDNGLVGSLSTPGAIADKAEALKDASGDKIGSLLKTAGAPNIDGTTIGLGLLEDPAVIAAKGNPETKALFDKVSEHADALSNKGELTPVEAHAYRKQIDDAIKFGKKRGDAPPVQEALYKVRDALNDSIGQSIEQVSGGSAQALKDANKVYSNASRISDMANNRAAMNAANRTIGLTDTIAGTAGASVGHTPLQKIILTGASVIGNKAARTFGDPLQASALWKLSGALKNPGTVAIPGVGLPALVNSSSDMINDNNPDVNYTGPKQLGDSPIGRRIQRSVTGSK